MTETERALVVLGYTDTSRRLLQHAGRHAGACGVDLVLLTVMPDKKYEGRFRARRSIPNLDPYTVDAAEDEGELHATRLAREVLADLDVTYDVESHVGRKASLILDLADERDCSAVFLAGHRNSRWHSSTFDAVMTEVVTEFDGPVTVLMGPELED